MRAFGIVTFQSHMDDHGNLQFLYDEAPILELRRAWALSIGSARETDELQDVADGMCTVRVKELWE